MDDSMMILNGDDALRSVCNEKGEWNWCLVGADPASLPLAGGGSGFVDEMRECLEAQGGGSVLAGMIRLQFDKLTGGGVISKWVMVWITLDDDESSMSAVQRGKATTKRNELQKLFKDKYVKVLTDTMEITHAEQLTPQEVENRVKKAAVIDGNMQIPVYEPQIMYHAEPEPPAEVVHQAPASQMIEEYEPELDAAPENREAAKEAKKSMIADEALQEALAEAAKEAEAEIAAHEDAPAEAAAAPAEAAAEEPAAAPAEEAAAAPAAEGYPTNITQDPLSKTPMDPLSQAAAEKKEEEKKKASIAKAEEASIATTVSRFNKGDLVDIWSHTENKWFTDGVIEEVREKASTTADGKPLPAGCAKIVYNNGQRGKWLQPEVLNDRSVVKPSIKPQKFTGFMKKETHNILSEWHVRYFELRDGFLTWWITLEDSKAGVKPQCCLELVGLQMKAADKSTKISIRTASSRGVVYNFDTNAGASRTIDEWVTALKQHAAFANRMYKFRTAGGMKVPGK